MGHSRYIGRVGALAVALGIGTAVASTPVVAWADEAGNAASSDGAPSGDAAGGGTPGDGQATSEETGLGVTSETESDDKLSSEPVEEIDVTAEEDAVGEPPVGEGDDSEPAVAEPEGEHEAADPVVAEGDRESSNSADRETTSAESADSAPPLGGTPEVPEQQVDPVVSPEDPAPLPEDATPPPAAEAPADEQLSVEPPAAPATGSMSLGSVLTKLLSPFGSSSGDVPVDSPLVWGLLAFARRQTVGRNELTGDLVATAGALDLAAADANTPPQPGRVTVGSPGLFSGVVTGRVRGSDADGDSLTFAGSGSTAKGSVVVDAQGRFTYTPTAAARHAAAKAGATEQDRVDSFVVTIADGNGGVTPVTVQVQIRPLNARPQSSGSVGLPNGTTGQVGGAVVTDDDDDDTFTYSPSTPAKGSVVFNEDGTFVYTPTQAAREAAGDRDARSSVRRDSFTVSVDDGHGGVDTVRFTVQIAAIDNDAPVAGPVTTNAPGSFTGSVTGRVTATDADGDRLTYTGSATTEKGRVTVSSSGRFTYTPTAAARHAAAADGAAAGAKTDTFDVTVTDGFGGSVVVPVTVTIAPKNAAPRITRIGASSPNAASGVVTVTVSGRDSDGDTLTFSGPATTAKGTLVKNGDGTFTYTPTEAARIAAGAAGAPRATLTDTVEITVTDGHGGTDTASVTVRIAPSTANAGPTGGKANPGQPGVDGKVSGTVTATDPNGDPLTFTGSGDTARGSVIVNANGTFVYTPTDAARHAAAANNAGAALKEDSFVVTVSDGKGGSLAVPVTVSILPKNAAPTGNANPGAPNVTTGVVSGSVSSADADGDPRTYSGPLVSAKGGTVVVNSDGTFTYTPTAALREAAAKYGATVADKTDTFVVTVNDGHVGGVVQVNVTVAIAPAANSGPTGGTSSQNAAGPGGTITGTVTATDPNGDPLTYTGTTTTAKGSVVVNPDGTFTYTPTAAARHAASANNAAAALKSDTFTVVVSDGRGGTAAVPVTVTISPVNAAPVGGFTAGTPNPSTGLVSGSVTSTDTDGDTRTYSGPAVSVKGGTVVVNADGTFTYTPTAAARDAAAAPNAPASAKVDSFTVTVNDGHLGGVTTVAVQVDIAPATAATAESTPGVPLGGVIIAANGTRYLVVSDFDPADPGRQNPVTRVSVLDANGKVLATSADIAGLPVGARAVTRPDGSLVLATTKPTSETAYATYVSVIGADGVVTPITTAPGTPGTLFRVMPDGTTFFTITDQNLVTKIVRISPANVTQFYEVPGFAAPNTQAPGADGSMYYFGVSNTNEVSVLVVDAAGNGTPINLGAASGVTPFQVASDGKVYFAYTTAGETPSTTVTKILTFTGSMYTVREVAGQSIGGQLFIAGADGAVYIATRGFGQNSLLRVTSLTLTSTTIPGIPISVVRTAPSGAAYIAVAEFDGTSSVVIVQPGGAKVTVPIPGEVAQVAVNGGNLVVGADGNAYVSYSVDGQYYVAVISATGSLTSKALPAGVVAGPTAVAASGEAYTVLFREDEESGDDFTSVLSLSTGKVSAEIPSGADMAGVDPLTFGPDGKVYRIQWQSMDEGALQTSVLVVNPDGTTLDTFTDDGQITGTVEAGGLIGLTARTVFFAPDGTAYVSITPGFVGSGTRSTVWAVTSAGATKVLDVESPVITPVTIAPDGTVYVGVASPGATEGTYITKVQKITPPTAL